MATQSGQRRAWDFSECVGNPHCPPRCPRFIDDSDTPWVLRPFQPADREALLTMYRDFAPDQRAQGVPPSPGQIETWLDDLLEEGWNVVAVADDPEVDPQIVGHALYIPADASEPELAAFVHQDFQERGIGTELCRHVVATASATGREALVLEVTPRNRRAIHVYKKVGFTRIDESADDLNGRHIRSLRMRCSL